MCLCGVQHVATVASEKRLRLSCHGSQITAVSLTLMELSVLNDWDIDLRRGIKFPAACVTNKLFMHANLAE